MGTTASYLEPAWTSKDAKAARPLPIELREKLGGLDYRVRKNLGRYNQERDDCDENEPDNDDDDAENKFAVAYHTEDVPESLDRLRIVSARFTIDLDHIKRPSSVHSFSLKPPAVVLPNVVENIPAIEISACFSITTVASTHRQKRKVGVGTEGVYTLGLNLCLWISGGVDRDSYLAGEHCFEKDWEEDEGRSSEDEDEDEDLENQSIGVRNSGTWYAPTLVGFATSPAFVGNIDAESQNGEARRWWGEKEHSRQGATIPLSQKVLNPSGPFADHVCEGGSILDLRHCQPVRPEFAALWKAAGCSRRSAQALWALFSRRSPSTAIATPFRRRRVLHSPPTALERLSMCRDVAEIIASFTLEPTQYTFEADIYFGIGVCNF